MNILKQDGWMSSKATLIMGLIDKLKNPQLKEHHVMYLDYLTTDVQLLIQENERLQSESIQMTIAEKALVERLGQCFNDFQSLESYHDADNREFAQAIHVCQNIVFSRVGIRNYNETSGVKAYKTDKGQ